LATQKTNPRIDRFDVEAFAGQIHQCKADYVIFTLGQNTGYYCSPNATYEKYLGAKPGQRCSKRDLPGELGEALSKHGVKLILYLPARHPKHDPEARAKLGDAGERRPAPPEFVKRWSEVVREWSLRYKDKVAGWWFDGCYNTQGWDWNTFTAACRAGNPDSILAFNKGSKVTKAFRRLSHRQDYTAGEQNDWAATPEKNPAPEGMYWHVLSYMGSRWSRSDGPRTSDEEIIEHIRTVNKQGGVVTIDVKANYEDGKIISNHFKQLLAIGEALKK